MRSRLILGSPVRRSCRSAVLSWSWFPAMDAVEAGLTVCVEPRRTGAVQRMDHDRLGVGVGGGFFLRAMANTSPFGGFVGLEPLVQPLVGDLEGTGQCAEYLGIGLAVPGGAEDLDQLEERFQPRLIARARAVHEPGDLAGQPLGARGSRAAAASLGVDGRRRQLHERVGARRARRSPLGASRRSAAIGGPVLAPGGGRRRPGPGRSGPSRFRSRSRACGDRRRPPSSGTRAARGSSTGSCMARA